jgi:hypothetical protein
MGVVADAFHRRRHWGLEVDSGDPIFARGGLQIRRRAAGLQIQQEQFVIY